MRKKKPTNFLDNLAAAVEARRTVIELEAVPRRLSPNAFVRVAAANAGVTDGNDPADVIDKAMEREPHSLRELAQSRGALARKLGTTNYPNPPVKYLGSLIGETAGQQLARLGLSPLALVYVAARDAAENAPERFGTLDSLDDHGAKLEGARNEYEKARAAALAALTLEDVIIAERGKDGWARVVFRVAPDVAAFAEEPEHAFDVLADRFVGEGAKVPSNYNNDKAAA